MHFEIYFQIKKNLKIHVFVSSSKQCNLDKAFALEWKKEKCNGGRR